MSREARPKIKINVLDDTVEIPEHIRPVFSAVLDADFDEPLPRCGEAIKWLEDRDLVIRSTGEVFPVRATLPGRVLARTHKFLTVDYGKEEAGA